jgi:hypothetical protein
MRMVSREQVLMIPVFNYFRAANEISRSSTLYSYPYSKSFLDVGQYEQGVIKPDISCC